MIAGRGCYNVSCPLCDSAPESICHLLFTCRFAQDVWQRSRIPLPPAGFSPSSVFLNLHYLVTAAASTKNVQSNVKSFPWVLWHIWKSRNNMCFEQRRFDPYEVVMKAMEDAAIWFDLHHPLPEPLNQSQSTSEPPIRWSKPSLGFIKCNIGSSWLNEHTQSGVSWIARNHLGLTLFHSRRSYSSIGSAMENDLLSIYWAVECLKNMRCSKVVFQGSSTEARMAMLQPSAYPSLCLLILRILELLNAFEEWSLEYVAHSGNQPANAIAISVTRDKRFPSYIARNSPSWLIQMLRSEASLPPDLVGS